MSFCFSFFGSIRAPYCLLRIVQFLHNWIEKAGDCIKDEAFVESYSTFLKHDVDEIAHQDMLGSALTHRLSAREPKQEVTATAGWVLYSYLSTD